LQRAGIKEYLAQKIVWREREGVSRRHCERQRSNPSLHFAAPWIASLALAMTT
jgi:hypothetical protein